MAWLAPTLLPAQDAAATPGAGDRAAARQAIRHIRLLELPARRALAARDLLALGSAAVPSLVRSLDDPRPAVVARLMLVLRMLGDHARPAIPSLRRLARSPDPAIARAARWGLALFEPAGVILVSESGDHARELDGRRQERFRVPASKGGYDVERLPSGNFLVCILNKQLVHEVEPAGRVVWKITTVKNPASATRLPSDHTLICSLATREVLEVDRHGQTVWRQRCQAPYSAERLADGNTLIADFEAHETFVVTPAGQRVWSYKDLRGPLEARRLSNGNTLITSHSQRAVHEVTPSGRTVLRIDLPTAGWTACRLPNGDTLVGGGAYLACFDPRGKERWKEQGAQSITRLRYY